MVARLRLLTAWLGLPRGCWAGPEGTGLVVHSRWGAVCWLGWSAGGEPDGGRFLELEPWRRAGVLRTPRGSGGTEDREVFVRGRVERFDAWSDSQRSQPASWVDWTHRAALAVLARVRCVLCGQALGDCRAGATDPAQRRFVCRGCLATVRPPAPRTWPRGERRCGFCDTLQPNERPIHESRGGCMCVGCMARAQGRFHGD